MTASFAHLIAVVIASVGILPTTSSHQGVPAKAPSACAAAEMHQFDFWIGSWQVRNEKDHSMGTNVISPIVGGCALHEQWTAEGEVGESFSIYDPTTGHWHQTWVDNKAHLWMIDGGMVGNSMVMTRTSAAKTNARAVVLHRWMWTPSDKDHVRQLYDVSSDGGKTWKTAFDGRYVRS